MNRFLLFLKKDGDFKVIGVACSSIESAKSEAIKFVKNNPNLVIHVMELKMCVETGEPVVTTYIN